MKTLLLILFLLFCLGWQIASASLLDVPDIKSTPRTAALLNKDETEWLLEVGRKSIAEQIEIIQKKMPIEILKADNKPKFPAFSALGEPKRSTDTVKDLEGLFGKVQCPGKEGKVRIFISEDAPPSTLLHQYIHALQMARETRWCALEGRLLDKEEKDERAVLYHRFEFEALHTLWKLKEHEHYSFTDRLIIIDGLNRERELLGKLGINTLDELSGEILTQEHEQIQTEISFFTWLNLSREDAGSVLQKMEALNLKTCAEQGGDSDQFLSQLNRCLIRRCELSGFSCKGVRERETRNLGVDPNALAVYAWTKPAHSPECSVEIMKGEFVDRLHAPTRCWKGWYGVRARRKNLVPQPIITSKIYRTWQVKPQNIDREISYFQTDSPQSFINTAYCYSVFKREVPLNRLPIDEYAFKNGSALISRSDISAYEKWLSETGAGRNCARIVDVFSGEKPLKISKIDIKKFAIFHNPIALLADGVTAFKSEMAQGINKERARAQFLTNAKLQVQIKKEWDGLTDDLRKRFAAENPALDQRNSQVVLREFFSNRAISASKSRTRQRPQTPE